MSARSRGLRIQRAAFLVAAWLTLSLPACAFGRGGSAGALPGEVRAITPGLEIRQLSAGVWMHTTWRDLPDTGPFPSHGLVVQDGDGWLLVDSAWGDAETVQLVNWIERELGGPVTRMLSTHHHDDRLSGSRFLQERGTRVFAHPLAVALAAADGVLPPTPLPELAPAGASLAMGPVEVFYPGAGHAVDNLVVWVPAAGILFGGCAVRPGGTQSLGNVADADLESWPRAIARVRARYAAARQVIPRHGPPGGVELLDHSISLLSGK